MRYLTRSRIAALVCLVFAAAAGGSGQTPEDPWKNVEFLAGVSDADMELFMGAMNASLGVECGYCHDTDAWHLDTQPAKAAARSMMRMVAFLGENAFEALELPSCWTCHRGATDSQSALPPNLPRVVVPPGAFVSTGDAGAGAYRNLTLFGELPARDLEAVMAAWSASLGVDCTYCHEPSDWASDANVKKLLSRTMYLSQSELDRAYFEGQERVTCWTCHRGDAVPAIQLLDGGGV